MGRIYICSMQPLLCPSMDVLAMPGLHGKALPTSARPLGTCQLLLCCTEYLPVHARHLACKLLARGHAAWCGKHGLTCMSSKSLFPHLEKALLPCRFTRSVLDCLARGKGAEGCADVRKVNTHACRGLAAAGRFDRLAALARCQAFGCFSKHCSYLKTHETLRGWLGARRPTMGCACSRRVGATSDSNLDAAGTGQHACTRQGDAWPAMSGPSAGGLQEYRAPGRRRQGGGFLKAFDLCTGAAGLDAEAKHASPYANTPALYHQSPGAPLR